LTASSQFGFDHCDNLDVLHGFASITFVCHVKKVDCAVCWKVKIKIGHELSDAIVKIRSGGCVGPILMCDTFSSLSIFHMIR
jgi:hypothetical protein